MPFSSLSITQTFHPGAFVAAAMLSAAALGLASSGCSEDGTTNDGSGGTASGSGGGTPGAGAMAAGAGAATGTGAAPGEEFTRTASELIADLSLGWNLGNSLDAPEGETAWNNPRVTPELLEAVADSGFDLVRIPVTWSLHMGPGPEFLVHDSWMARVEEVVGYALDAGLYVIINVHHDGADGYGGEVEWLTLNDPQGSIITAENNAAVQARFTALWKQIAARFAHHGEAVIFESMNEIHDGYGAPDPAYFDIINELNQLFVDLVRASSGNNRERYLVVPGYNTNIGHTLDGFEKPSDPTPDRLILSVHYYDPWDFAGAANTQVWGSAAPGNDGWGQEDYVLEQFDALETTFVDTGLPVILGEYGAVHQTGYEDYRRYYMEYVTKAALDREILPVYWDNGSEQAGQEAFGLFSRTSYEPLHPEVLSAMQRAAMQGYELAEVPSPSP